jgi:hypothetical protein
LPDGLFTNQKSQFGENFQGLRLKNVDIFKAIWNVSPIYGIFYDQSVHFVFIWYIFSGFGTIHHEKSGNPVSHMCNERDASAAAEHNLDLRILQQSMSYVQMSYVESFPWKWL